MERVIVLGASSKPERYAYKAMKMLKEHGYEVIGVNPAIGEIDGTPVVPSLDKVGRPVDTITVYLSPSRSEELVEQIIAASPRRVIFNPGTESEQVFSRLRAKGIRIVEACTLVLLRTGGFESA